MKRMFLLLLPCMFHVAYAPPPTLFRHGEAAMADVLNAGRQYVVAFDLLSVRPAARAGFFKSCPMAPETRHLFLQELSKAEHQLELNQIRRVYMSAFLKTWYEDERAEPFKRVKAGARYCDLQDEFDNGTKKLQLIMAARSAFAHVEQWRTEMERVAAAKKIDRKKAKKKKKKHRKPEDDNQQTQEEEVPVAQVADDSVGVRGQQSLWSMMFGCLTGSHTPHDKTE